jgi:mono/diheme cytochrome c family protein
MDTACGGEKAMIPAYKRLIGIGVLLLAALIVALLFAYDVIKINFNSFMEIQPSFQPMNDPLPVPTDSIPIEGPAYVIALGAPTNPIPADQSSISRGNELYHIICSACHGDQGKGNGPVATYLKNKPADLTGLSVQSLNDGGIFMVISNGIDGKMPALNENLTVQERWDVVNYVRTLK